MTIWRAVRGPGPRCFDADAVWIGKIGWIGDSTGPASAGKPQEIEAKIPLARTQSLISWNKWIRESPLQRRWLLQFRRACPWLGTRPSATFLSCDPGLSLFGQWWLGSPAGAGIHPGSESGTCFRTNDELRGGSPFS